MFWREIGTSWVFVRFSSANSENELTKFEALTKSIQVSRGRKANTRRSASLGWISVGFLCEKFNAKTTLPNRQTVQKYEYIGIKISTDISTKLLQTAYSKPEITSKMIIMAKNYILQKALWFNRLFKEEKSQCSKLEASAAHCRSGLCCFVFGLLNFLFRVSAFLWRWFVGISFDILLFRPAIYRRVFSLFFTCRPYVFSSSPFHSLPCF